MRFILPFVWAFLVVSAVQSSSVKNDYASEIFEARKFFNSGLLTYLDHQTVGKNILISPFGLHSVLSSVLAGSEGNTFNELWKALGYKSTNLNRQTMLDANEQTFNNLTDLSDQGLTFANLLAFDKTLNLNVKYCNEIGKAFGTGTLQEDFKKDNVKGTNELNDWIKIFTKGKIPAIFDKPLDEDTRAVLLNALHFKSNWLNQFDPKMSFKSDFKLGNGQTKQVTFMTIPPEKLVGSEFKQYFDYSIARFPFESAGRRLWFSIIKPDSVSDHLDCCSGETWRVRNTRPSKIALTFPKFNISQTHDKLVEIFQKMGVNDLFDSDAADLSDIDNKNDLYVKHFAHKVKLNIDETGSEGAAATGVVMSTRSAVIHSENPPIEFYVDRPFVFTISDKNTNVELFTGLIYDP